MTQIDFDILPDTVGYHLRRAQVALFGNFNRTVGDLQVTPGQFGVLTLIDANPGLTQSALARAVGIERSTMVAAIDVLQGRGLVERRSSQLDRRSNALHLSEQGEIVLGKLKKLVRQHEERVLRNLTVPEREQLRDMLRRIWIDFV